MLLFESALALMLVFGIGSYAGQKAEQAEQIHTGTSQPLRELPDTGESMTRMLQCRAFCGDERTRSYDSLTGMCKCGRDQIHEE